MAGSFVTAPLPLAGDFNADLLPVLLFVIAFLYFAAAIGVVVMLFLRPRLRRRAR